MKKLNTAREVVILGLSFLHQGRLTASAETLKMLVGNSQLQGVLNELNTAAEIECAAQEKQAATASAAKVEDTKDTGITKEEAKLIASLSDVLNGEGAEDEEEEEATAGDDEDGDGEGDDAGGEDDEEEASDDDDSDDSDDEDEEEDAATAHTKRVEARIAKAQANLKIVAKLRDK